VLILDALKFGSTTATSRVVGASPSQPIDHDVGGSRRPQFDAWLTPSLCTNSGVSYRWLRMDQAAGRTGRL
jgi:hypothetical protein